MTTTINGFKVTIKDKKCVLLIPEAIDVNSEIMQKTKREIWEDIDLPYFDRLELKKFRNTPFFLKD